MQLVVTAKSGWEWTLETAVQNHGKLNMLVNNAGIVTIAPLDEAKLTAGNELINVNQKGCSQV